MLKRLFFRTCKILGQKNYADNASLVAMYFTLFVVFILFVGLAGIVIFSEYYRVVEEYRIIIYPVCFVGVSVLFFYLNKEFKKYGKELEGSEDSK